MVTIDLQADLPSSPKPKALSRGVGPDHHSRRRSNQCLHQHMLLIFSVLGHVCALHQRRFPRKTLRLILLPQPAARVLMISRIGRLDGPWHTNINAIYLLLCFMLGFYPNCLVCQCRSLRDLLLLLSVMVCNESIRV